MRYNLHMGEEQISAVWFTSRVQKWLQKPTAVAHLQLFDHVINLVDTNGEIISIVQPAVGVGPFSLMVACKRPFPSFISSRAHIQKTAHTLTIGEWQIDWRPAQLWQARPPWAQLRQQQNQWLTFLPEWQTAVAQNQERLTVGSPRHFISQLQTAIETMRKALAQNGVDEWQTAVAQLAGLGPGLTPAGDDFLLGLLLGLWATRPEVEVAEAAKIVVETAVPRTTQLSAAWLQAAARGEAWLTWHHFLEALLAGAVWQKPFDRILNNGATSGIAALNGFIAAASSRSPTT